MINYNYTVEGHIQFFEKHNGNSSTNGFYMVGSDEFKEIIGSGVEIAPHVEPAKALADIRAERDSLLDKHVDIYNPMRWAELTTAQKDSVKSYRQALLDITQQDPTSVVWPEPPLI